MNSRSNSSSASSESSIDGSDAGEGTVFPGDPEDAFEGAVPSLFSGCSPQAASGAGQGRPPIHAFAEEFIH